MYKVKPKPYKLIGKIQNYEWGTKDSNAFIPNLLNSEVIVGVPYAEYWIGTHSKAPSEVVIDENIISFKQLIDSNSEDILGKRVSSEFNNSLPFLLKVLSIDKALSIQAHPNKELAKELHRRDPKNYPDENHKPEIAVAIDELKAIVGLKPLEEIIDVLNQNPEIKLLTPQNLISENNSDDDDLVVKKIYTSIMNADQESLKKTTLEIHSRLIKKEKLTIQEKEFLIQYDHFGIDIGLISILLFNYVNLRKGEAFFTPAGIPHAYLKGNIIECMANSDNVVRAGLTPKYKDVKTLLEMLELDLSKTVVDYLETAEFVEYHTPAKEFKLMLLKLNNILKVRNDELRILIILDGEITIKAGEKDYNFISGETVLIPALLKDFSILSSKKTKVYQVTVPN